MNDSLGSYCRTIKAYKLLKSLYCFLSCYSRTHKNTNIPCMLCTFAFESAEHKLNKKIKESFKKNSKELNVSKKRVRKRAVNLEYSIQSRDMVNIPEGLTGFFHIHFCCYFFLFLQQLNPVPLHYINFLMLPLVSMTTASTSYT